jgi:hypothetical protein
MYRGRILVRKPPPCARLAIHRRHVPNPAANTITERITTGSQIPGLIELASILHVPSIDSQRELLPTPAFQVNEDEPIDYRDR